jgi:magnesium chelatase family protein
MSKESHSGNLPPKINKEAIVNHLICATLDGLNAKPIEVEATFTKGLPGFSVVGLASSNIQEAKERVKSALLVNEFKFPPLKITVNLSPSDIKKSGTHLDLSIALLVALYKEKIDEENLFVFGELGLDGRVKSSSTLFPIILSLKEQGVLKRALVPQIAMEHLSHIADVEFIPVETLKEAQKLLQSGEYNQTTQKFSYNAKSITINSQIYYDEIFFDSDFLDVKGQSVAKRASLISATGMHNFMMEGNPGCGKSMIAKRLKDILPPLLEEEMLSIAKHQFLDGITPDFKAKRPMRSPHHTATSASIFGGGSHTARIGEVALAHNGMLFFDELPHFPKNILEALREPLQDRRVNISRVNAKIEYEADIMFVSAMNPCPCGNLLSKRRLCRCSEQEVKRYKNRLSDPFLDRIDIFVTMQEI